MKLKKAKINHKPDQFNYGMLFSCYLQILFKMENNKINSSDPLEHTTRIKKEFKDIIQHLKEDISKVDDLQAKALFEVSAEVIDGLHKAFSDFEKKDEEAWVK